MGQNYDGDVEMVRQIPAVPSILDVVCKVTGMGFAAVARVTEDRWIACEVLDNIDFGLKSGGELRIETTICNEIRDSRQAVIIDHVSEDKTFSSHHTPALYGFQSYISMPIILADGSFFGTLCAIDPRPMRLNTPETIGMFKLFAELIAVHVDARSALIASRESLVLENERLAASQGKLLDAQAASELREQFIAVLGHDLRNPLAAISGGTNFLLRRIDDDQSRSVLQKMAASVQRMAGLIDNVMDFARGRLGGGLTLTKTTKSLEPMLVTVMDEIKAAFPHRQIEISLALAHDVHGDHARLGQLFSNLLGNAIAHGSEDSPVRVEVTTNPAGFTLVVENGGTKIPPETLEQLFQPFRRGKVRDSLQGLGLGLFIASEIAKAHGGTLTVVSDDERTRFTLTVPGYVPGK
ncbi:GAF domain-containing sensor histidine kinase [Shinella sp. CPCC 100929]|uniref:histidine kinase n=1 Tax=Shinella lacus TaxID=2654216 RepID=A0ABT1R7T4_9HYPH|nr:GAF domain-containing sensor histidine kinase [Shinella lacus]MCQ4631237.1 GAF domain-containing sensor histidine kinase [Shinella lacus]